MTATCSCRTALLLVGAAAAATLGFAACGQGDREMAAPRAPVVEPAQETTSSAPTTATTEAPTTTVPPETTTTAEQQTTAPPETTATTAPATATTVAAVADEGSDIDWGLVGLIAAIVVAVGLLIWLIADQVRSRGRDHQVLARRLAHLVGGSQWVHDQASLELMSGSQSPERLRSAWGDTRRRLDDLAAEASEAAVGADKDVAVELRRLGNALGRLEGAIDTNVELRLQSTGDVGSLAAVDESLSAVNQRRHELQAAIGPLAGRV